MREYIKNDVQIDGRNIPYTVFTAGEYFKLHDKIKDTDDYMDTNPEITEMVTQIIAIKSSCFLLRHTTYSCQSLSDSLYILKLRLIQELKEKYHYEFDDSWLENLVCH